MEVGGRVGGDGGLNLCTRPSKQTQGYLLTRAKAILILQFIVSDY